MSTMWSIQKARYELIFDPQTIENYTKVEVYDYTGNQPPILYFSPTDSKCNTNREQLAKGGEMWIKKLQFKDGHFYLVVECSDGNKCDYSLRFSSYNSVVFDSMRVFNYYVGLHNLDMTFQFQNNNQNNPDEQYITLKEKLKGRNYRQLRLATRLFLHRHSNFCFWLRI